MKINNEEFKQIPHYHNYVVSCDGKVYNIKRKHFMYIQLDEVHGYQSFCVKLSDPTGKRTHFKVHRLVALAWIGEPPSELYTDINHIDGNSLNNHYSNLEWCTKSQNQRHALANGLKGFGESLYNSQLSDKQVHEICNLLIDGLRHVDIARMYGVSSDIISKIKSGDSYFHVRSLYDIPVNWRNSFSESTVQWVCERILDGYADEYIAKVSTNKALSKFQVKRIRNKIRYKSISDKYF